MIINIFIYIRSFSIATSSNHRPISPTTKHQYSNSLLGMQEGKKARRQEGKRYVYSIYLFEAMYHFLRARLAFALRICGRSRHRRSLRLTLGTILWNNLPGSAHRHDFLGYSGLKIKKDSSIQYCNLNNTQSISLKK